MQVFDGVNRSSTCNIGGCLMAVSPTQAPVYGGGPVSVTLPKTTGNLDHDSIVFLVYEAARQRHVTVGYIVDACTVHGIIPAHNDAEVVKLSAILCHGDGHETLAACPFYYHHDSAFYMAQYLLNSVYSPGSLEDLELIQSEHFDLANEVLSTLDDRLSQALISITLPDWWNILGSDTFETNVPPRETLFHFTARLGLNQVATVLLGKPGSEEALRLPNRHGYLPREIALNNCFDGLAELLSNYNARVAKLDYQKIETRRGVIVERGGEAISLTSWTRFNTSLEDDLIMLQKIRTKMEELPSPSYLRQFQSHWPGNSPNNNSNNNNNNNNTDQHQFEDKGDAAVGAIYQKSKQIQNQIQVFVETVDDDRQASLDDLSDTTSTSPSDHNVRMDMSDEAVLMQLESHAYDGSISSLREFNEHLSQLQSQQVAHNSLTVQDIRKENLSRFSSSCPSLDTDIEGSNLLPIGETDHHKSMHDLLDEADPTSHLVEESYLSSFDWTSPHFLDGVDSNISICVNGVEVNNSGEFLDGSINRFLSKYYGGNVPCVRRRSWCAEIVNDTSQSQRRALKATMLAISGKSVSLPSLDGNGESEDEESFHDARENQTPSQSQSSLGSPLEDKRFSELQFHQSDAENSSPNSLTKSPAGMPVVTGYTEMKQTSSGGTGPTRKLARSKGDIDLGILGEGEEVHVFGRHTEKLSKAQSSDNPNDSGGLSVPHSTMTKSLSTPSIPAAVKSPGNKKGHKDAKPASSSFLLIKKLLEEHDAQIRRQEEVQEEEDESSHRHTHRSEVTLYDFLNEQSRVTREDSVKSTKKEEKKKKTGGVFSRIQSSYRIKKSKDKENKNKSHHQFLSISFSNNTLCDVCHKHLANKLALHCKNCLLNVHENSCKDQISPCNKFKPDKADKGPLPRGDGTNGNQNLSLRDKQSQSSTLPAVSSLRTSHSFKEKRSSSAPVRPQSQSALAAHRHSLPSANNVISEENESDLLSPDPEINASNITEAISESLESLDEADGVPAEVNQFDEALMMLRTEEPEAWNLTVDKKTLKKMGTKDVKRQDHIWELIQTERHHCRVLKIIQNIYSKGILNELHMPLDLVERLFPRLDDLIEVHMSFLHMLQDLQKKKMDRSIDEIGATLLQQFSGPQVERMKLSYGSFCSGHKEAVQLYKDLLYRDRKFQTFIKKCNNYSLCKKREIPDFILLVTTRPTKYPTLIEAILKSTKDKKDRENLSQSLQLSKDLLKSIDEQVDAYERRIRLEEIYTKMDSKSTTLLRNKKFKRSDLLSMSRRLLFEGNIWWKNARGKVSEVIAVILTDLILFIQESNQKYVFVSQDNKPGVIPLFKLLVREKGDTRDISSSKGIYLISQNRHQPEMYELVCKSAEERATWISVLRTAVERCPEVEEEPPSETEEEKQKLEARSARVRELIEKLHMKDLEIKQCCDEKNKLMVELVEVYTSSGELQARRPGSGQLSRPNSHGEEDGPDHVYALQAALQEAVSSVSATASRLTGLLQNNTNGTQLTRHVSSVGEHISSSFSAPFIPKRAETFAGFDSSSVLESPKAPASQKRLMPTPEYEGSPSPSVQNLARIDSDSELDSSQLSHDQSFTKMEKDETDLSVLSERPSDGESLGDISGSSSSSINPPSVDYLVSIRQLNRELNSIV
ncbi:hypothetical protein ScPMuIL_018975, partial [Solemya velum]